MNSITVTVDAVQFAAPVAALAIVALFAAWHAAAAPFAGWQAAAAAPAAKRHAATTGSPIRGFA